MDHLADAIDKDLKAVEEEVNLVAALLTESYIQELKEFCASIYNRINGEFKFSAEKLARLDQDASTGAVQTMKDKLGGFSDTIS